MVLGGKPTCIDGRRRGRPMHSPVSRTHQEEQQQQHKIQLGNTEQFCNQVTQQLLQQIWGYLLAQYIKGAAQLNMQMRVQK